MPEAVGEKVGSHQCQGLLLQVGRPKPRNCLGKALLGGPAQNPQLPGVTRAHVCLPRAKLSAQLSDHGVQRGVSGDLRKTEQAVRVRRETCRHKAREASGVQTWELGLGGHGELGV